MATRPIHIMVIGAHPADVFDQVGGTIAHHIEQGDKVTALVVTTGVRSHDWETIDEKSRRKGDLDMEKRVGASREKKLEEVRKACDILGITNLRSLNRDDDLEVLTQDLVTEIGEQIREVQPDMLVTHHPHEEGGYKFHATVGQATLFAFRYAGGAGRSKTKPRNIRAIYLMNPGLVHGGCGLGNPGTGHPDIYVDITDVIEKKIRALDCIKSQFYNGLYSLKRAETEDGAHGSRARVPYAEQFQRFFPWVCYTLPISDFELYLATETSEGAMARQSYVYSLNIQPPSEYKSKAYKFNKDIYK